MNAFNFTAYDAFSAKAFGGSQAAVVTDASAIKPLQRQKIAREIGMPATAFVDAYDNYSIAVQFYSTVMELPMCGHGTISLLTHLAESQMINFDGAVSREFNLVLPKTSTTVTICQRDDKRVQVMLDIVPPRFVPAPSKLNDLLGSFDLSNSALESSLSPEIACGDFVHLILPLTGLDAMRSITPDFDGIVDFCHRHEIETVAAYCLETLGPNCDLHVRDFCPAVGVNESAAAGTTNAALSSYLVRHKLLTRDVATIQVNAEQGLELGRPSSVESIVTLAAGEKTRLQVGGVATKTMQGQVFIGR